MRLQGKTTLRTGAGRSIDKALALLTGRPNTAAATAAKTELLGLVRAFCNLVMPGFTETERHYPEWYSEFRATGHWREPVKRYWFFTPTLSQPERAASGGSAPRLPHTVPFDEILIQLQSKAGSLWDADAAPLESGGVFG
jgi:hypothetical protein